MCTVHTRVISVFGPSLLWVGSYSGPHWQNVLEKTHVRKKKQFSRYFAMLKIEIGIGIITHFCSDFFLSKKKNWCKTFLLLFVFQIGAALERDGRKTNPVVFILFFALSLSTNNFKSIKNSSEHWKKKDYFSFLKLTVVPAQLECVFYSWFLR